MKLVDHLVQRSIYERSFHAIMYEILAIVTSTPLMAWVMNKPILQMGALSILISVIAMIWNGIFNYLFDLLQRKWKFKRTFFVRLIHGASFEAGIILFTVPLVTLWLNVTLLAAFLLEAGMLLYFFPYTVVMNWCYDRLKSKLICFLLKRSPSDLV